MNLKRLLVCMAVVLLSIGMARAFILTSGNYQVELIQHSGGALNLTSGNYSVQDMKGLVFYTPVSSGQYAIGPGKYVLHPQAVIPPPTVPTTGTTTTTIPGVIPPGVTPEAPVIEEIWFGNRLYQKSLVAQGQQFITTADPKITIKVAATSYFGIDPDRFEIIKGTNTYTAAPSDIVSKITYAPPSTVVQSMTVEYNLPQTDLLSEGTTDLTFRTYENSQTVSTDEVASVTVVGGEPRVVGVPIIFPSPVRLKTDKQATFQYTLSHDVNVDLYVFDISARVVKKMMHNAGQEGGSAGINKINWDLITDQGTLVASGIHVFTIVELETGRPLGRGKFTVIP
jgi:hypothetical protein